VEAVYHGLMSGETSARQSGVVLFLSALRQHLPAAGEIAATWGQASEEQVVQNDTTRLATLIGRGWEIAQTRDWQAIREYCEALSVELPPEITAAPEIQSALDELTRQINRRIPTPPVREEAPVGELAPSTLPVASKPQAAELSVSEAQPGVGPEPPEVQVEISTTEERDATEEAASTLVEPASLESGVVSQTAASAPSEALGTVARLPQLATAIDYARRADAALRAHAYANALLDYTRAFQLDPALWSACYNRALVYKNLGAYDKAVEDLDLVIEANPSQSAAYRERGLAHSRLGKLADALVDYDHALARDPDDAALYSLRGNVRQKLGAYDGAIADYDQAIRLAPSEAEPYLNRGLAYAAQGGYVQAIADYGQAIVLQPDQALAYHYRGQAYAKLSQYAQALSDYAAALSLRPTYAAVHVSQGLVYVRQHAYEEAIAAYDRALATDSGYAPAWYNAACAAALLGDVGRACVSLHKAIELRPQYRDIAARDPDFAKIRQASEFAALVSTGR
jgi:tetratricopeptide (TPR) repeat protein